MSQRVLMVMAICALGLIVAGALLLFGAAIAAMWQMGERRAAVGFAVIVLAGLLGAGAFTWITWPGLTPR